MVVLLVSAAEIHDLIAGKASKALVRYVRSQARMDDLLPDENLPHAIVIERLDDTYACTYRCYGDARAAERAIQRVTAVDRDLALAEAG